MTSKPSASGSSTLPNTATGSNQEKKKKMLEDISDAVFEVSNIRKQHPSKLKESEDKILRQETSQAEQITMLPAIDPKRFASKYPLKKPLPEDFQVSNKMPLEEAENLEARVEKFAEEDKQVIEALKEVIKK